MGRQPRTNSNGRWFHVMNRGAGRRPIFDDDRDRIDFEQLLGSAAERFGVRVHAYCWMTNHFHLLVDCPDGQLSEAMHLLGSQYVRHVNRRRGSDGPLFRSRFTAKPVDSDAYLVCLIRYIHRNPLAFVTPGDLIGYRWSSLRAHLGFSRTPHWLSTEVVADICGGSAGLEALVLDAEVRSPPLDAASIRKLVDVVVHDHASLCVGRRPERSVATVLLDRLDTARATGLARLLEFPTPEAERMARSRARRAIGSRPELRSVVDAVADLAA